MMLKLKSSLGPTLDFGIEFDQDEELPVAMKGDHHLPFHGFGTHIKRDQVEKLHKHLGKLLADTEKNACGKCGTCLLNGGYRPCVNLQQKSTPPTQD